MNSYFSDVSKNFAFLLYIKLVGDRTKKLNATFLKYITVLSYQAASSRLLMTVLLGN